MQPNKRLSRLSRSGLSPPGAFDPNVAETRSGREDGEPERATIFYFLSCATVAGSISAGERGDLDQDRQMMAY